MVANRYPYIYKITLLQETESFDAGAVYIGQTNGRYKYYFGGGTILGNIVKRYGRKAFKMEEIVRGNFTRALLDELEKHYIRLYASLNSIKPRMGMNIIPGGSAANGSSSKICYKYDLLGNFIFTKEFRGYKIPAYIKRDRHNYTGKYSKAIYQYSTDGVFIKKFENAREVGRLVGFRMDRIARACDKIKEGNYTCGGYIWAYEPPQRFILPNSNNMKNPWAK